MSVTIESFGSTEVRTALVGVTLSATHHTINVSSDRAMIDSGNRLCVTYWDAENWQIGYDEFPTDDTTITPTVDAPPAILALAGKYRKLAAWFNSIQQRHAALLGPIHDFAFGQHRFHVQAGDRVVNVRARKCPKGEYEVALTGFNDYGPYVHLRDAQGQWHRYINVDMLSRPEPTTAQLRAIAGSGSEFHDALVGVLALGNRADGWLALCDWLRDHGRDEDSSILHGLVRRHYRLGAAA